MVRASISVALGGISRRSDPLGRIYGWIPLVDLLGPVTRVPYLVSLYRRIFADVVVYTFCSLTYNFVHRRHQARHYFTRKT